MMIDGIVIVHFKTFAKQAKRLHASLVKYFDLQHGRRYAYVQDLKLMPRSQSITLHGIDGRKVTQESTQLQSEILESKLILICGKEYRHACKTMTLILSTTRPVVLTTQRESNVADQNVIIVNYPPNGYPFGYKLWRVIYKINFLFRQEVL